MCALSMDTLHCFFLLILFPMSASGTSSPTPSPTLVRSSQNNIKTYAGTGSGTSSGTGGLATAAGLAGPRAVVQDSTGLFYFNEGWGSCIRKVSSTNILSVFAGSCGTDGYGGDNGQATASLIWFPVGIAFDTAGNFYINDFKNFRTRFVSTTGIISTIAGTGVQSTTGIGGQATSANLNAPHGLWISSTNQIYMTLYQDATIKVFTKGGTIQSVGGTGTPGFLIDGGAVTSAQFQGMEVITGDSTGKLYVADSLNHRVRLVSSGIVSTIAGWGATSYNGEGVRATASGLFYPCGIAIDTGNLDMYMNARGNNRVQVVTKTTGLVTTFAGTGTTTSTGDNGAATAATMNANDGMYIDTVSGQMYITEFAGNYIRKIYTVAPSVAPTVVPSVAPSIGPSRSPTVLPSVIPTLGPSALPSLVPSLTPTVGPSLGPTVLPSIAPTAVPTLHPTLIPTEIPSVIPSISPTAVPSLSPSVKPTLVDLPIRDSPSYKVSNALAFAGITSGGGVMSWGAACCGGDSSSVSGLLESGVVEVVQSRKAFAALKSDGSVVAWGAADDVSGSVAFQTYSTIVSLVATDQAFAGVTSDGGVIAFGANCCGGNVDQYGWAQYLTSGVSSVRASAGAVCALKSDGTVYCWGSKFAGGGVSSLTRSDLSGVVMLSSTRSAFAGMTSGGSVVVWGNKYFGGALTSTLESRLSSSTLHILSNAMCFAAYLSDGSLEVWGGYDGSLTGGFQFVASTSSAFAAKSSSSSSSSSVSVVGNTEAGGDVSSVSDDLSDVAEVVGNTGAFAAITSSGEVVAWGDSDSGGRLRTNVSSAIGSGVNEIYHTSRAFAMLNGSGGVTAWGKANAGGFAELTELGSNVKLLCANDNAFTAIKEDGTAYIWGCVSCNLNSGLISGDFSSIVSC